ncbi:MAG: EFR1 family ferrodoxin [Clostridia bacterium]|nr:EFR1 family ferrodoxin [Clostridia bacterium]
MIFYFSGTGNSLHAARTIPQAQGVGFLPIAKEFDKKEDAFEFTLADGELLGFVFPVYAWAPPKMVLDFIARIKVTGGRPYVFSVCTCGDEEGRATRALQRAIAKKGLALDSAFTVQMPNNYILGFDVDPKDVEQEKLRNAGQKLEEINRLLAQRQSGVFRLIPGSMPALKTTVVNPLFNRFAMSTKKFYATDACTRCGLCEKICPVHTITVKEKPAWGKACTQCLACINRCPARAIQYGSGTVQKGRYAHPDCDANSN